MPSSPIDPAIRDDAAAWLIRRDRGLSAAESIEYELWLAADERHGAAMQQLGGAWQVLDRIPDATARRILAEGVRRRASWRKVRLLGGIAAGLAFTAGAFFLWPGPGRLGAPAAAAPVATVAADSARTLRLPDGTLVRLNRGSEIAEQFSPAERRVVLMRGEAHFIVNPEPARPFVVRAGSVDVSAVGTAFNVNLQSAAVEVIVTEGTVKLAAGTPARTAAPPQPIPLLNARQRAVVALTPVAPEVAVVVTDLNAEEMARTLAWHEPLLRFGGATLAELAGAFERRTGRRVVLTDPGLANLRLGGGFRADDLEGFAALLGATLDIEVEPAKNGALILRKKVRPADSGK